MEDLCELVTDGTHDSPKLQKEGVPFIKGKNISSGIVDFSTCDFITQEDHTEACRRVKPRRGDILFSNIGSVGDTAVVNDDREFSIKNVALFRPDSRKVNQRYFYYLVLSPDFRSKVMNVRSGSAQPFISLANLRSFEVNYVEDTSMQRRIAGILSAYDELIENSQRRIKILESMARALYREWFVHFRFPGHESVPLVPSSLGEIPQGWEVKKLESLMVDHIGGGWGKESPDDEHTEPAWVIRGTDIPNARSSQVSSVPHRFHTPSNLRSRKLAAGDIIFEVSGGSKGQPVGRVLLITSEVMAAFGGDVICASFCKRVRPDAAGYGAEVLYLSFLEGYESGEIEKFQVQSTGISNFKWTEYIAKTERVVSPEPLRAKFREHVAPLFTQVATLGLQIQNLRRTRDLLLPRLLSSQIDLDAIPA